MCVRLFVCVSLSPGIYVSTIFNTSCMHSGGNINITYSFIFLNPQDNSNGINEDEDEGDQSLDLELECNGAEMSTAPPSSRDMTLSSSSSNITSTPISLPSSKTLPGHSTIRGSTANTPAAKSTKEKAGDDLDHNMCTHNRVKISVEDEHETFAKTVSFKMRKLNPGQCFYAEKLINDVLFEAGLGELNRMSCIVARPASGPVSQ